MLSEVEAWSLVPGSWFLVSGFWFLVSRCQAPVMLSEVEAWSLVTFIRETKQACFLQLAACS
jgi:hypothetical protein